LIDIKQEISREELNKALKLSKDPIAWCEEFLVDPGDPMIPYRPREYQKPILLFEPVLVSTEYDKYFTNRDIAIVMGRGGGKTLTLAARILHKLFNPFSGKKSTLLIIAPYSRHIEEIFNDCLDIASPQILNQLKIKRNPFTITNKLNGSEARFFPAGISSATKGKNIRGQGMNVDEIIVDECDIIPDEIIASVIFPIRERYPYTSLILTSTPSGKRTIFYSAFHEPAKGYILISVPATKWLTERELEVAKERAIDDATFEREYLCNFNVQSEGVYLSKYLFGELNDQTDNVEIQKEKFPEHGWNIEPSVLRYNFDQLPFNKNNKYYIGVDFNGIRIGVVIVVLELVTDTKDPWYGKLRLFRKFTVEAQDAQEKDAAQKIIDLNYELHPLGIYVDSGFGEKWVEKLQLYAENHPNSKLSERLVKVPFGGKIKIRNPKYREFLFVDSNNPKFKDQFETKKAKAFMVQNAVHFLKAGKIILPDSEQSKRGLVTQLVNYQADYIEHTLKFSNKQKIEDHLHDAWILALYAYFDRSDQLGLRSNIETIDNTINIKQLDFMPIKKIIEEKDKYKENLNPKLPDWANDIDLWATDRLPSSVSGKDSRIFNEYTENDFRRGTTNRLAPKRRVRF